MNQLIQHIEGNSHSQRGISGIAAFNQLSKSLCLIALGMVLFMLAADRGVAEEKDVKMLRVMTFNIRYDNSSDGVNRWRNRKEHVAAIIRDSEIDIVGMQEVLHSQLDDLKQRLPDHSVYGVGRDDGKTTGEHSPIFFSSSRFGLLDRGTFWLSETPETPGSKSWDAAITRIVSWVKLQDQDVGRAFFFFNTHFDHQGAEARLHSAELFLRKSREIAKDEPVVIGGDFNCLIDAAPLKTLTEKTEADPFFFADAKSISQTAATGPNSTWNGFKAIVPDQRFDFILVTPAFTVQSHATREDKFEGRFPSDHLPVQAELLLKLTN